MPPRVSVSYICLFVLFLLIFLALRGGTDHPPYPSWFATYCVYAESRLYAYFLVLCRSNSGAVLPVGFPFLPFFYYFFLLQ
ncbi:hypothetical protein ACB092_08G110200 [Castanea dentata]